MALTAEQFQTAFERCIVLHRQDRLDEAVDSYRALATAAPFMPQVHFNLGLALKTLGAHDAAAQSFRNAIAFEPQWAEAHVNLALALQKTGRFAEAEQSSRKALHLKPDLPEASFALGSILRDLGQFEAAIAELGRAVQRHPTVISIRNNLGLALRQMGRLAEAEAVFRAALAIHPGDATLLYNIGELDLLAGRLPAGWEGLEHRWQLEGHAKLALRTPLWDGRRLPEGSLLLVMEQGFGDSIQFCRYVPMAAARAHTVLLARPELYSLMKRSHPGVSVLVEGDPVPEHAMHCPLPSLPRAFATTLATIPDRIPYLSADPSAVDRWRRRLAPLQGLRVGVVWSGNPNQLYDRYRSVALSGLTRVLTLPGVTVISLQTGDAASQIDALPTEDRPLDWSADLTDFAETAALIQGLDLVIGVDTAVIHLTGALGKPGWVLTRFDADWRWPQDRDDSPWYPSLRQFRQPRPGDWPAAIEQVEAALRAHVAGRSPAE